MQDSDITYGTSKVGTIIANSTTLNIDGCHFFENLAQEKTDGLLLIGDLQ